MQEYRHKEKMKNKNEAAIIANVSNAQSAPLQSDAAVLIAKLETAQKFLKNKSDLIDYMEREIHKDPDDPEYREYDFSKLLENARDLRTQIDVAKAKKTEDLKKIIRSCNPTAEQKAFFGKLVSFGVDELRQMESCGLSLANASSIYKTALTTPQNTKEETITLFQEFVEKVNNRRSNPYGESQTEDDFDFSAFLFAIEFWPFNLSGTLLRVRVCDSYVKIQKVFHVCFGHLAQLKVLISGRGNS
jgi:hypothetical protein